MTVKGKSRRGAKQRNVAAAPKVTRDSARAKRRRWAITPLTVLAGLFALTMIVVIVWAVIYTLSPTPVAGLSEYNETTKTARMNIEASGTQILGLADEVIAGTTDVNTAAGEASARSAEMAGAAATIRTSTATAEFSSAKTAQEVAALSVEQAAKTMGLMNGQTDAALTSALAKKAAREVRLGFALLGLGNGILLSLEEGQQFEETPEDVADPADPDPYAPAAPLDGLGEAGVVPAPKVNLDTQSDDDYAKSAIEILAYVDTAIANMGDAVSAYESSKDAAALQTASVAWAEAIKTGIDQLAATARPETIQAADALLRNALWAWFESAGSFASVATQPGFADQMLNSGKALRLMGDQLRASAAGEISRATEKTLPAAPSSGFPASIIDPSATTTTVPSAPGTAPQVPGGPAVPAPGGVTVPTG